MGTKLEYGNPEFVELENIGHALFKGKVSPP
jgi:hypothetical protein